MRLKKLDRNGMIRLPILSIFAFGVISFVQFYSDQGHANVFRGLACIDKATPMDECIQAYIYQGAINSSGVRQLDLLLSSNRLEYLCFDSGGGSSTAAVNIAKLIKEYQLKTCVSNGYRLDKNSGYIDNTSCISNCIPTLLSASERHLFGDSIIRTHRIGLESICIINRQLEKWGVQKEFSGNHPRFISLKQYKKIIRVGHKDMPLEFDRLASDTMDKSNYCGEPDENLSLGELEEYKIFTQTFRASKYSKENS